MDDYVLVTAYMARLKIDAVGKVPMICTVWQWLSVARWQCLEARAESKKAKGHWWG